MFLDKFRVFIFFGQFLSARLMGCFWPEKRFQQLLIVLLLLLLTVLLLYSFINLVTAIISFITAINSSINDF